MKECGRSNSEEIVGGVHYLVGENSRHIGEEIVGDIYTVYIYSGT